MKKTLEELEAIRQKTLQKINLRKDEGSQIRVVIGMATCGIAAGARPVMLEFVKEIERRHLTNVSVSQTGCIGMCRFEPMVDVYSPNQDKITYVNVKPEMVEKIVLEHVVNGNPVVEYTIGHSQNIEGNNQ